MELESEKQLDWYCGFWGESGVSGHVFLLFAPLTDLTVNVKHLGAIPKM